MHRMTLVNSIDGRVEDEGTGKVTVFGQIP